MFKFFKIKAVPVYVFDEFHVRAFRSWTWYIINRSGYIVGAYPNWKDAMKQVLRELRKLGV